MSVPVIKIQDPKLDIVERNYYAKMGGSQVTYNEYSSVSESTSQVVWSTTTPSVNVGVDRRMYWETEVDVDFSALVGAGEKPLVNDFLNSLQQGFRQFPLARAIDTLSLKLNNATMTINLNDLINPLQLYGSSPDERNRYMSGSPSYPDVFPSYVDAAGGAIAGARNPYSQYTTNVEEVSRAFSVWLVSLNTVVDNGNRVTSARFRFREPLFIPPMNWSEMEVQALFGVQTIDITMTFGNFKNRMLSGVFIPELADPRTLLRFPTNYKPKLHVLFLSPQINQPVPKLLHYPYYQIGRYITPGRTLAGNEYTIDPFPLGGRPNGEEYPAASQGNTIVSNITLHSVPKRLYIYARPSVTFQDANADVPDLYGRITHIDINWNNQAGILSSANEHDLYKLSVKNGLDQAWREWANFQGSVLCIEPSSDLGLSPLEAPGSRGNYQLQYNLTYRNLFPNAQVDYNVYTVVINEGFMTINDSVISLDIGVLTEQAILDAPWAPPGSFNEVRNLFGGGFFGDIWKGIKKIAPVLGKVAKVGSKIVGNVAGMIPHPLAQGIAQGANIVNSVASDLGAGRRGGRKPAAKGGRRMSTRSLSRRT